MSLPTRRVRIYSRCGDLGETSLYCGPRVGKDHYRMVLLGALDELNAQLGLALSENDIVEKAAVLLRRIQSRLFVIGAEVSSLEPTKLNVRVVGDEDVRRLERAIDSWSGELASDGRFIVLLGSRAGCQIHLARAVCRRAERRAVALYRFDPKFSPKVIAWINRLSDLLYVVARYQNAQTNHAETFVEMKSAIEEFGTELI